MLFSCLIDADRTRTEEFCAPENALQRSQMAAARPELASLRDALDVFLQSKQVEARPSEVNRQRAVVLEQCRAAAQLQPGFFSLNVPTGGGKTLSSLAFALEHALQPDHDLRRVVMAIPFTSIIEQTADVYRQALGSLAETALVEHHTSLQPARDTRANQLGTENWDAPLIVTTNVQLLESPFAYRTTPCRKLHNLARSVIVLDESQTIPLELLKPALAALRELVLNYGCTIVLCTATQPALERRDDFAIGIENVRHIIPDAAHCCSFVRSPPTRGAWIETRRTYYHGR
jgi:CRISPR-associated endonuclease/helicase Cas3